MTSVYIFLSIVALSLISIFVYIIVNWKKWTSKQRKYSVAGVLGFIAIAVVIVQFSNNVSMTYAKPSELMTLIKKGEVKLGERVKIEGKIKKGSIKTTKLRDKAEFILTDGKTTIPVVYRGVLPDNLKPGVQTIAIGAYNGKIFKAEDRGAEKGLSTKCPSKYKAAKTKKKE